MEQLAMSFDEPERWLPVVDYEGLYEVSNLGRVKSLPRKGTPGGILKACMVTGRRYLRVGLSRDRALRTFQVHILVARAFLGPCREGLEVCHGPVGSLDNRLVNLSYGTHAKNMGPDKRRDGTANVGNAASRNIGSRNANAKLNDEIVREIRSRAAGGESLHSLSRRFGVTRPTIRNAVKGATWRHVPLAG